MMIKNLLIIVIGKIISFFLYDKKYLKGKYFSGYPNILGWKMVIRDGINRVITGSNKNVPWPVSHKVTVTNAEKVIFDLDDYHIFHTYGTYFQAMKGKIIIGKGTYIAPNVGIITTNHNIYNLEEHEEGKDVIIGNKSWLGMNSVILPGVELGEQTIVAAGSVVTNSFTDGKCIIAGTPAKIIKRL